MFDRRIVEDYFIRKAEEIKNEKLIERDIKIDLIKGKAISVVGPRRAGKTSLLKLVSKQNEEYFFIDFEHVAFLRIEPEEIFKLISIYSEIFSKEPKILFLDEIQNLKNWESVVRSLLDSGYLPIISGSSSKLLSGEIATQLRGRSLTYYVFPFSFREFLKLKDMEIKKHLTLEQEGKIKGLLRNYILSTSYPEILITGNYKLLSEYYNSIFYRDFVERFKLKSFEVAKFIFNFFLQNFSREISINKIVNFLKSQGLRFGKNTVYEYVEKLPETLNVFLVEKLERSVYRSWPKKAYICDLGLVNITKTFDEEFGRRVENIVFLELMRKKNISPLLEIYYLKINNKEIDFVVKEGLRIRELIQVTYASSKDEIKEDAKSLSKAFELFKKDKPELIIITWDYEDVLREDYKEIKCIPLWKWLLDLEEK